MSQHQSAYGSMGMHGTILGEGDTYLAEVYQLVDDEVD